MLLKKPPRTNAFYKSGVSCDVGEFGFFVFGSNIPGRHGIGAARYALRYGAKYGVGVGPMGRSYAIPTKTGQRTGPLVILDLETIEEHVKGFVTFTNHNPLFHFLVTPIGTGLASYSAKDIAPMFKGAINCWFIEHWRPFLETV